MSSQLGTFELGKGQLGRGRTTTGAGAFVWSISATSTAGWVVPPTPPTWRIDGAATLTFEGSPINFWVIQGFGVAAWTPAVGGVGSAWAIDGVSTAAWTGGVTSSATWRIDGAATAEWLVRPTAAAESCLTGDGTLPTAPGQGSAYVF